MPVRTHCRLIAASLVVAGTAAQAQELPPPAGTVYKCVNQGRVLYTDSPCPGAKALEVTPPSRSSPPPPPPPPPPRVAIRPDRPPEAPRPAARQDATPKEVQYRRFNLTPRERTECRRIDDALPAREADERAAAPAERAAIQAELQRLRERFRQLGC